MHIWLVAPYYGGSHRAWADGYIAHSQHHIELFTHAARFWKWRMHGAAATLAEIARQRTGRPDLLLVTDMLNLPAFLGLLRKQLDQVPVALYCHENQLTYPIMPGQKRDLTYGVINWMSMLAADCVLFNSNFHLRDWFDELPRLLKHFPDYVHLDFVPGVRAKSQVLPVGCDLHRLDRNRTARDPDAPPLILWNQRWEYDKSPEQFFRALDVLAAEGLDFQVALAGSNVRQRADEFEAARERLGERVIHYGRASAAEYARLLWQSDIVVSTALHEFFGIAIVEAIYCGCFPILPDRLSYPERIPDPCHQACLYQDFDGLVTQLRWAIVHITQARSIARSLHEHMVCFDWDTLASQYDTVTESII